MLPPQSISISISQYIFKLLSLPDILHFLLALPCWAFLFNLQLQYCFCNPLNSCYDAVTNGTDNLLCVTSAYMA